MWRPSSIVCGVDAKFIAGSLIKYVLRYVLSSLSAYAETETQRHGQESIDTNKCYERLPAAYEPGKGTK